MKTVTDHIRDRLLTGVIDQIKPLSELRRSEWSERFERLMRNRLLMGAYRYGLINAEGKPQYNRSADIIRRINDYIESGNLENLVDAANLAMLEFEDGQHPKRHFTSNDDTRHAERR